MPAAEMPGSAGEPTRAGADEPFAASRDAVSVAPGMAAPARSRHSGLFGSFGAFGDALSFAAASGVAVILEQRCHQVVDEGFALADDRACANGELVRAALWFLTGDARYCPWSGTRHVPGQKGRIDDLTKAGAFIAAEIARLRAAAAEDTDDAAARALPANDNPATAHDGAAGHGKATEHDGVSTQPDGGGA